jgi:YVTN family beta-propeller protein
MREVSWGRAAIVLLVVGLSLAACSRAAERAPPRPAAYVSDEEGGYVVVVDTDRDAVKVRISVGKRPRGLKISHDNRRLFVALSGSPRMGPNADPKQGAPPDRSADGIGIVDLETNRLVRTLKSGQDPESFDLSPDDKTLYVSNEETAEMSVLDVSSGTVKAKVPVGHEPEGVTVRPDGKVVFVTSEQDNEITAVDTDTLAVLAQIPTGPRPRSIVLTSDGRLGFATSEGGPAVTVVDANRYVALATIPIVENSPTPAGPRPMGAVLSRDEKQLYVSTGRGGSVAIIDVATRKQVRSIDGVGNRPWGIVLNRDGTHLYTANGTSNDFSKINIATGNVDKRVLIGGLPWGVALGF